MIEKDDGCNYMTCTNCGTSFAIDAVRSGILVGALSILRERCFKIWG